MTESSSSPCENELNEIRRLLWGPYVKDEVFKRWAQGFQFSEDEPTALVQWEGGPCAVIAPVQAFILKILLSGNIGNKWRQVSTEDSLRLLIKALCEILSQAQSRPPSRGFSLVHVPSDHQVTELSDVPRLNGGDDAEKNVDMEGGEGSSSKPSETSTSEIINKLIDESGAKRQKLEHQHFHSLLRVTTVNTIEEVEDFFQERIDMLQETFGVLLLLYSVLMTKGCDLVKVEMSDGSEALIDGTYGYGSQSLINLMLTGRAVGHVWDHDQDAGGLKLRGIDSQSEIGFLALLEHLRYCEVGSFFKNPKNPVWVMGSDTHLTVLFSQERKLVSPETPSETARRVFKSFDPEGNNFISSVLLQDVLTALDLVSDPEYVDIMRKKLDSENLGIILLTSFMEEFFPEEKRSMPDVFTLYHYNGLARSSPSGKVEYWEGNAVLLECDVSCILESNSMLTCLQTKWPSIEVQWKGGLTPSLN
ncbi:ubiquitin carboxyl-terminal hydrolase MINDY-3 homolog [Ischnura elegans]|uniref:ubiquitin carboxyl-terminal hydrolase MINDY-3 homolog n=1 Tax=Ischnura elegans TaxID=197161 RepID=UPI001ED86C67|nr:ubiquitin carboxyl-terminal hydrolase MINDY-3 homolog [Ischnura elegans]